MLLLRMGKRSWGEFKLKPEFKTFSFKLDDADSKGIIRGFASTFGNIDLGDDVMEMGAFKKTLKENKGIVPILDSHDPTKQIGWNMRAEETDKGLFVEGKINLESQLGREKYALAKQAVELGAKMGLSIGYGTIKADPDKDRPRVRRLKEVKLYEYSIVTFPMNTEAMITAVKQMNINDAIKGVLEQGFTLEDLEKALLLKEAAAEPQDPLIEQSLDNLIKLFKGE